LRPVTLAELVDPAGGIHHLLLARIEGMARRADFDMQRLAHGRRGDERVSAAARHQDFRVLGMNARFHDFLFLDLWRRVSRAAKTTESLPMGAPPRVSQAARRRANKNYPPSCAAMQHLPCRPARLSAQRFLFFINKLVGQAPSAGPASTA